MPNLVSALKEEIRRLAKKEIKAYAAPTKQTVAKYRSEIAALKREIKAQAKKIAALENRRAAPAASTNGDGGEQGDSIRFSAKSVRSQRQRLGFSAMDYGRLVGVSHLTIYKWEKGETRPRKAQLAALAAVRGIGKREALKRIAAPQA